MPANPATSPNFGAPRWSDGDDASFSTQVNGVTDVLDGLAVRNDDPKLVDQRVPSDGSVSTAKLANGAVTGQKIAAGTITEANLAAGSVGSPELIDGGILTVDLADNAVTAQKLAPGAAITPNLADAAVTLAKLAAAVANALHAPGDLIVSAAPARVGAVPCDGKSYPRADPTYAALFAAIGTQYGSADANSFNVPLYSGRTLVVAGQGAGLTNRALGALFGEETHVLTEAEMPSHTHGVTDPGHAHGVSDPSHAHSISDPGHAHAGGGRNLVGTTGAPTAANIYPSSGVAAGHSPAILTSGDAASIATDARGTGIGIYGAYTGIGIAAAAAGITIRADGGGAAHTNTQPSAAVNVFIKL